MRRTVVFASYSKQGIIADYILYYLRCLHEVADRIIFIADNEVRAPEQEKLEGIVIHMDCK
jgi:lipopolysaccharide biosynthesis protein